MHHVALVPFTGLRIKEQDMLELGMSLPSLSTRATEIAHLPALGLLTLAGMTPPSWTQSYHESKDDLDELTEEILATKPTLVAMSALTASISQAYELSARLRTAGTQVVLGGLHVTACPNEAQQHCDSVVVGEGEPVWLTILSDAENNRLQHLYKADEPFDLGHAPIPRFDLLPAGTRPRMTIQTQRGCPLACDFCGASRLLGPFREKPTNVISRELDSLSQSTSARLIELADDNTFAGKRDHGELFDLFSQHKIKYFTEADWRIGEDSDLLGKLAASGCVQILVGIESLELSYAGMGAKRSPLSRMMDAVSTIQDHGIAVIGCFIVGNDGETAHSIEQLGMFLLDTDLTDVQLTLLTPFPGTALFRRLSEEGRLLRNKDWSSYTLFDVTYQPKCLTVDELGWSFKELLKTVYAPDEAKRRSMIKKAVWSRNPSVCN